jgi:hypothetical protein
MRLYGGAQYHRAMAEFRLVVSSIKCPPITREEIVNACGVEDIHDGTNYSRYSLSQGYHHEMDPRILHYYKYHSRGLLYFT